MPTKVLTRNSFDSDEVKGFKHRAKARQETINKRPKSFGILSQTFCSTGKHCMEKHKSALEACLVLVQYKLANGCQKLMKI